MPWTVSGVVEKREDFLADFVSGDWTMSELCRMHGISRPTGYAVLRRYTADGDQGLAERSHAPQRHPNQTPAEIEQLVLELRRAHPLWGPRPLKKILEDRNPQLAIPAASTIGAIVEREGLTRHRRKRRRVEPYQQPFASVEAPNDEWACDFKGWMRTGDGERIDPLTISDSLSRYLLRCQAVDKTDTTRVQAIFEAAFREYGLPRAVRSDNGPPFASCAVAGLSRLSVWWIKLGILPERIEAGHPEQNGRHERMHRTLKEAAASPPKANRRMQQRAFDQFRREYNEVRPHQALAMETPESVYRSSPRPFPARVPEPEYDTTMKVRRVFEHGQFFFNRHNVFLSKVLYGERIGLLPIDDRYQRIYLAWYPIARLDTKTMRVEKLRQEDRTSEPEAYGKEEIPKNGDSHLPTGTTTAGR
jgi:transposase InsO family protein